jgi:hypothetical protein
VTARRYATAHAIHEDCVSVPDPRYLRRLLC